MNSFASHHVSSHDTEQYVRIVSILHVSWPLSTCLNIVAGYLIDYVSWIWVFILFGILLMVATFYVSMFVLNDLQATDADASRPELRPLQATNTNAVASGNLDVDTSDYADTTLVRRYTALDLVYNWRALMILFVSFWMSFRSRSIYIVISSFWMEDVFGLSASVVGWTNVIIVV